VSDYKVTLTTAGQSFDVRQGETILDAAIRENVDISYSCRNGTCRTCICRIIEGEVKQEEREFCMISDAELEEGRRLICLSVPQSDVVMERVSPRKPKTVATH